MYNQCFLGQKAEVIFIDLFEEIKNKLRITWEDDDERLKNIITRAENYLNSLCNFKLDFSEETDAKTLMMERVFYDYNNALKDFEVNYEMELKRLLLSVALEKERRANDDNA